MNSNEDLIRHLKENTRVLREENLEEAFRAIDRKDFVDSDYEAEAYEDYALPIGENQTISQPTTVAYMLELLSLEEGDKVLDVGSGSGWTTALLNHIVGDEGRVIGLEIIPELQEKGTRNLQKYFPDQEVVEAKPGQIGHDDEAPYDRILVSAAFEDEVPEELLNQLEVGGVMVAPVDDMVVKITKTGENSLEEEKHPGFRFVPYV